MLTLFLPWASPMADKFRPFRAIEFDILTHWKREGCVEVFSLTLIMNNIDQLSSCSIVQFHPIVLEENILASNGKK
jgi:hypothetical protein